MNFSLENLAEVELENYVKDHFGETEEYKENEKKNHVLCSLKKLISKSQQIGSNISIVYDAIKENDFKKASVYGTQSLTYANRVVYEIRKLLSEVGIEEESGIEFSDTLQIVGEKKGDILHLILPELLPDKVKEGEAIRYAQITYSYLKAFQKFFSSGKFPVYEEKAVLVFYHFYKSELFLKDHDNFEYKQIIDILSAFLLTDDNPKWCSNFMDYRLGKTNHTEIYVVPQSQFINFLQQ